MSKHFVQTALYDFYPPEIVKPSADSQKEFLSKFERKKTTDDCCTPPEVYDVVLDWIRRNLWNIESDFILRPFYPGGDYLAETYYGKVVIDNPPFSIYSKIIENYERLKVLFFLFAPALTTFVKNAKKVSYIIAGANIRYANGALVRTNFVTNLCDTPKIIISHDLRTAIENAQRPKKTVAKCDIPAPYLSSAQLLKFSRRGNYEVNITHDYITHNAEHRKIFGTAVKINNEDYTNLLNTL